MKIFEVYYLNKEIVNEDKNLHLSHLEDSMLDYGWDGASQAINVLNNIIQTLKGHTTQKLSMSIKYDGSPAIIAGINPENGKFFVGTKSVFSRTSKACYTPNDVKKFYGDKPELAEKILLCLKYLKPLGIKSPIQGDFMFDKKSLKKQTIDGIEYLTFKPNTIMYAVPIDSELAQSIQEAELGIIWHTQYSGKTLLTMEMQGTVNIDELLKNKKVWMQKSTYVDLSGIATLTNDEYHELNDKIIVLKKQLKNIDKKAFDLLKNHSEFSTTFKLYTNQKIRSGEVFKNPIDFLNDFLTFFKARKQKDIDLLKTDKAKMSKKLLMDETYNFFKSHYDQLINIIDLYKHVFECKNFLIKKLNKLENIASYVHIDTDYRLTPPEGFVVTDHITGNIFKLVDRLEFSYLNFNHSERTK